MLPSYVPASHADTLIEHVEALERRDIRRLIVSMPPRHGKTLHVSQGLPAWFLGRNPESSVILASYGAQLAEENSRKARAFAVDPRWPFNARVSQDSSAVARWQLQTGGGLVATGVGGALTGFGADLLIVDDPIKGREEADSEAIRESTWRWWSEVALTRLQPDAAVLLTATRWHEDDLTGRVLASPGATDWTVLELPALAGQNDQLGREEGDALWPAWYPRQALDALRADIGERAFQALYQQAPTPDQGAIFLREWLQGRYAPLPDRGLRIVTAVDASFGKSVQSDYSAVVTVASDRKSYYVLHAKRGRWDFATLCEEIKCEAAEHNPHGSIIVEDAAAGQSAIQELKRTTGLPIIPVKPQGSKLARAESVTPLFESERVFFPANASRWRDELIEELAGFPTARFDDQVDAVVYGLSRLRGTTTSVDAPDGAFGRATDSKWGALGNGGHPGAGWTRGGLAAGNLRRF